MQVFGGFVSVESLPKTPLFIYDRGVFFQAVGRGFDPRLPLHVFNSLEAIPKTATTDFTQPYRKDTLNDLDSFRVEDLKADPHLIF